MIRPDLIGYLGLCVVTFALDLLLLVALAQFSPLPVGVCVLVADGVAWGLNFELNRTLNFRSLGRPMPQTLRYGVVVVVGVGLSAVLTTVLAMPGLGLVPARMLAGLIVALIAYVLCRIWVFPRPPGLG